MYYNLTGTKAKIENAFNTPMYVFEDLYEDAFHNSQVGALEKIAKTVAAAFILLLALPLRLVGSLINVTFREAIPTDVYNAEFTKWKTIFDPSRGQAMIPKIIQARITQTSYKKIFVHFDLGSSKIALFKSDGPFPAEMQNIREGQPGDVLVIVAPWSRSAHAVRCKWFELCVTQYPKSAENCTNDIPKGKEDTNSLNLKKYLVYVDGKISDPDFDSKENYAEMDKLHALYVTEDLSRYKQMQRVVEVLSHVRNS